MGGKIKNCVSKKWEKEVTRRVGSFFLMHMKKSLFHLKKSKDMNILIILL